MSWQQVMRAAEATKDLMLRNRVAGERGFVRLLKRHPGDGMIYFQRGLAYESLTEDLEAAKDLQRAIALFPKTQWKQLAKEGLGRIEKRSRIYKANISQRRARVKHVRSSKRQPRLSAKSRRVWVVYGRDDKLRREVFIFLRSLALEPLEFPEARKLTKKASPYVGEILDAAFQHAQAVVVLLSPDDEAKLRPDLQLTSDPPHEKHLTGQARPNVLFEAGMAFVSHPNETILIQIGELRPFSDIAGKHIVHLDNSTEKRHELASRLDDAGCPINWKATDWHTAGNFAITRNDTDVIVKKPGDSKVSDVQHLISQREDDHAVRDRLREALEDQRFRWRTLKKVAAAAAVTEDRAVEVLRPNSQICFRKNTAGHVMVALRSRVNIEENS